MKPVSHLDMLYSNKTGITLHCKLKSMAKVKIKKLKQNCRMKTDCVKIAFSYSADLPYKYIQSHGCSYSELEKHPRITLYSNFREGTVMLRVSRSCILSFTLWFHHKSQQSLSSFQNHKLLNLSFCWEDKCTSAMTARQFWIKNFSPIIFQALRLTSFSSCNNH